ncbi:hypothetical protein D3C81_1808590 [compost metagenome]
MTGALTMLGQEDLAGTALDLCELDLGSPAGWREADRLLDHLQAAVAPLAAGVT